MSVTEGVRKGRRKIERTADETRDRVEEAPARVAGEGRSSGGETITGEVRAAIREAALEILRPAASKATTAAAKLAVTQGPKLAKNKVGPAVSDRLADAGGAGALVKGVAAKAQGGGGLTSGLSGLVSHLPFGGGGGRDGATGTGRGRRLPVQEWVDVAASIDTVYDQFTQFEDFPKFMHRVEKIEQRDDTTLMWHENIWGIRRQWEATITDQEPCVRIAWRSDSVETVGVVTFHKLAANLTRVYMTVDFQPKGLLEKSASGLRLSRRAVKSDLMRFKAFVEMEDEPSGAWRGRIEDGDLVDASEEPDLDERDDEEEYEDEAYEDVDDEPDETPRRPRRRSRAKAKVK